MNSPFYLGNISSGFSLCHGFLPVDDPNELNSDCSRFEAWESCALSLHKLIETSNIRETIEQLPTINIEKLTDRTKVEQMDLAQLERLMGVLSFLAHAYVWCDPTSPAKRLPKNIAQPWCAVAKKLGRPPVLSYASYALYNWRRLDKTKPIELGNICLRQNFLGGIDEEWFILIHVDIEAKAIPALQALVPLLNSADAADITQMKKHLNVIEQSLHDINSTMDRMPEKCDPYIYYHRVRPYIHGWKNNPALPQGLIYEGVEDYENQPIELKGETGAQSTIIPCLDAVFGIEHENNPLRMHLNEMRDYMPPEHIDFLSYLESRSSVRSTIIASNNPALKETYNRCLQLIHRFRTAHYRYAAQYINKQSQVSNSNPTDIGTGGTPFMAYLNKHKEETQAHML